MLFIKDYSMRIFYMWLDELLSNLSQIIERKNGIKIREELNSVNIKKTEDFLEYGGTKQEQKRFFKKQGFLK